jgi:hypothetical protein
MDFGAEMALRFDCSLNAIPVPFPCGLTRSDALGEAEGGRG